MPGKPDLVGVMLRVDHKNVKGLGAEYGDETGITIFFVERHRS